jgi:hypothetical protein
MQPKVSREVEAIRAHLMVLASEKIAAVRKMSAAQALKVHQEYHSCLATTAGIER